MQLYLTYILQCLGMVSAFCPKKGEEDEWGCHSNMSQFIILKNFSTHKKDYNQKIMWEHKEQGNLECVIIYLLFLES